MVFVSAVLSRFMRLANMDETVTLLCRSDAAGMSFLFPRFLKLRRIDFRRLDELEYRWQTFIDLHAQHYRLIVSLDYVREHDQDEALEVADRIVLMNHGRIEQVGTPEEVYDHPANPFVYNFLGSVNLFYGRVREGHVHLGATTIALPNVSEGHDAPAVAYVRPHEIRVSNTPASEGSLPARIMHVNAAGPIIRLELVRLDDGGAFSVELTREQSQGLTLQAGAEVHVELRNVRVFTEDYSI